MNISILDSALYYQSIGYSIIPISKDKKPLIEWKKYQTVKAIKDEVNTWFAKYPQANIGIITGKISGLVVVDIDPRHNGKNDSFKDTITVSSKTGGGGWHYYFQYEDDIQNATGIQPGVDIRGEGGYVIAPPSITDSGAYEWMISPQSKTPIIPLPSFIKEWISKTKTNSLGNWNQEVLQGVADGERNNSATSYTGKLLSTLKEKDWESIGWIALQGWNEKNKPPLFYKELRSVFNSIAQRQKNKPKDEIISIPVILENKEEIHVDAKTEKNNMLFHPALTIDVKRQNIITSFPKMNVEFEKEKYQLNEAIIIVESSGKYWELNSKEMKERKMFPLAIPSFGYSEPRWSPSIMLSLKNEAKCDHCDHCDRGTKAVHPYKDLFIPIKQRIDYFIDFAHSGDLNILTLWIIGTYLFPIFEAYPYIYLGGMRGSGKTKVLDILQQLVFNPESTSNSSTSSLFRTIQRNLSTVLLDEGESLTGREANPELRLLFNAGYKKSGVVTRTHTESFNTERFKVYSPKAIASINPLEATLASRCITIIMLRTANQDRGKRRINDQLINWQKYRDNLYKFLINYGLCIAHLYNTSSDNLSNLINRDNELYLPLFCIASFIDKYIVESENKILPELQKYVKESLSQEQEEGLDDWSFWVLEALNDLIKEHREYLIKDIKKQIIVNRNIDDDPVDERMTNKWIGSCLRKFGLKRGKAIREGKTYWINSEQVSDLKKRYGVYFDGHEGHDGNESTSPSK